VSEEAFDAGNRFSRLVMDVPPSGDVSAVSAVLGVLGGFEVI
jgi:hypothetical protein